MAGISICQLGRADSSLAWSVCFRKVEFCQHVIMCQQLVHQRPSICYHVYVVMHLKDPQPSVIRVGHLVPLAGFCLSLYRLHTLNRDVNMIQTNKQTNNQSSLLFSPHQSKSVKHVKGDDFIMFRVWETQKILEYGKRKKIRIFPP